MNILKSEIEDLVQKQFGEKPISVNAIYQGGMNYVYAIALSNKIVMLKAYPPSRSNITEFEYNMLREAYDKGVKVPRVISFGKHNVFGFLFYHCIFGNDLIFEDLSADQRVCFASDLLENIMKFSELESPVFGAIDHKESSYNSWDCFLTDTIDTGLVNLKSIDVISRGKFQDICSFLKQYRRDFYQPGMAFGDLKSENIIVNEGKLAAIVDLESCFYGDPLISLGYLYAREGASPFYLSTEKIYNKFLNFQIEDVYFYALIRLLRISQHLKNPMPTGRARDPITTYFKGINNIIKNII
ncbi:fructosamine-3-kinase [Chryseobacterium bernardetii]|uniref:Fructosamine-3-kinase n=1 Tax=Chryseobacterium bernardetii TaxID=1241978 RepID=A0ACC6IWU9_9FLAO|nr:MULTISPECIES: phosphotransferase [Chryseobacterium]MDR6372346.1 fructosamine-3-kinase [Chryseobacterium vietnamense]MDR6442270.1 fructosamine-3-kinase [Chryseobacterium bernardetii]